MWNAHVQVQSMVDMVMNFVRGSQLQAHLYVLVTKRTELHIDSLLKRGCGNHCLGRLSSCGARRKNSATAFVSMALVTEVKNMIVLCALGPIVRLL